MACNGVPRVLVSGPAQAPTGVCLAPVQVSDALRPAARFVLAPSWLELHGIVSLRAQFREQSRNPHLHEGIFLASLGPEPPEAISVAINLFEATGSQGKWVHGLFPFPGMNSVGLPGFPHHPCPNYNAPKVRNSIVVVVIQRQPENTYGARPVTLTTMLRFPVLEGKVWSLGAPLDFSCRVPPS